MIQIGKKIAWLMPAALAAFAVLPVCVQAGETQQEDWNAHYQATYIWQQKPSFAAPYTGEYSLRPEREKAYTFSATAFFGWRPWRDGEFYVNPEVVQGVPMSQLRGLGGMTNGEQQKSSGPHPTLYRARMFVRQTWNLGGEREAIASDANQLAGMADSRRVVITAGSFAVIDIFDSSAFAHDPRTQFLNWALLANGAFDFAADARGYSWGAAAEYMHDDWAIRFGRFMVPKESNGLPLDTRIFKYHGDQIEIERKHVVNGQEGKLRLLAFRNKASMGGFRDALADAAATGGVPDVASVRRDRAKHGVGINAEQHLSADIGVFARASWNDGKSETYAFTEIERALSLGTVIKGGGWRRQDDRLGFALIRNGLSQAHRDYLAAGGHGAFIGDGRLRYRPESIAEAYYSFSIAKGAWLTFDLQHIVHPAYNADRGPVRVGSIRLHAEY
jgi:hypothetical protein